MKLDAQHASEIDLSKRDVACPKSAVEGTTSCSVPVEPTGRKFAERIEYQSGQRFLNGSAPRLKRHVAFCETAAGDVVSLTAGKDEKPFREFEGGALISAEGAVPLSCFIYKRLIVTDEDSLPTGTASAQERRALEKLGELVDTHNKLGRKKGCGAWTVRGTSFDAKQQQFIRLNCKCWECRYCGPRRAKRCKRAIAAWAEKLQLNRFVTLTLDPKKLNGEDPTQYLNRTFSKFRSVLHRRYGKALSYIRVLEYQQNGNAHFHLLLNQFIDVEWLRTEWQAVGGGWNVWIKMITIRRIVGYLSKYLTKDLLMSAPKGSRRVTTSRDIRLFEKPKKDAVWELLKAPIERLRRGFEVIVTETYSEIDGLLAAFTVLANVA
jgi:hypothetical protein